MKCPVCNKELDEGVLTVTTETISDVRDEWMEEKSNGKHLTPKIKVLVMKKGIVPQAKQKPQFE